MLGNSVLDIHMLSLLILFILLCEIAFLLEHPLILPEMREL
jgi:hypothetical protein